MSDKVLKEYRVTMKWAAIQGLFAFVIVGMIRSVFDFGTSLMQEYPKYKATADKVEAQAMNKIGSIFTFVTILCVINMMMICKMQDIKDKLGNATLKFHGTRLLLLVAQIQPQVLNAVTVGMPLYVKVKEKVANTEYLKYLHYWTFTPYQAKLLHAALLSYWCLFVAIFNSLSWKMDPKDIEGTLDDLDKEDDDAVPDYIPLPEK